MNDNVNHPAHYTQGGIECIDALKAATVGKKGIEAVCVANVIKYLWRYEEKNGIEDIRKAQWYINRLIKEFEEKDTNVTDYTEEEETEEEEEDCCNCLFRDCDPTDGPCANCKNNYVYGTEPYKNHPLNFRPNH